MTTDLVRLSASQIESFWRCPRRWWYERNRPRGPQHPAAAYGERVHDVLQSWHERGIAPDLGTAEGRTAVAGLDKQPPPLKAQAEFKFVFDHGPIRYNGRIDLAFGYRARRSVTVADHKTTSDLRYAKSTEDLADDAQRIIYAHYAATTYGVAEVTARWIYYQRETDRRNPRSLVVEFSESAAQIADRFADLHVRKSLPIVDARAKHPNDLPRHWDACSLYPPNGCPYREECHASADPLDRLAGAML